MTRFTKLANDFQGDTIFVNFYIYSDGATFNI